MHFPRLQKKSYLPIFYNSSFLPENSYFPKVENGAVLKLATVHLSFHKERLVSFLSLMILLEKRCLKRQDVGEIRDVQSGHNFRLLLSTCRVIYFLSKIVFNTSCYDKPRKYVLTFHFSSFLSSRKIISLLCHLRVFYQKMQMCRCQFRKRDRWAALLCSLARACCWNFHASSLKHQLASSVRVASQPENWSFTDGSKSSS